jgi:hypothetical protein
LAACALLSWNAPDRFLRAYLIGFMASWAVAVGATGLLALGSATGGQWAAVCRPFYLAIAQTMPLVAVLFLPIALNLEPIYPWAAGATGEPHAGSHVQAIYFDRTFFLGRAIGYFIVWLAVVGVLTLASRRGRPAESAFRRRAGAIALVLIVPTASFAAFDWAMSLEPQWHSSIYGAIFLASGALAAHALATCGAATTMASLEPAGGVRHDSGIALERANILNDLGNLMLAFLMVFAYFAFSQFLIIWSGNLPAEIVWYIRRLSAGWEWLAVAIVVLHFVVPFLSLLSRDLKRSPRALATVATLLLVMFVAHTYWAIAPAFATAGAVFHGTNFAAIAALGGGMLAAGCLRSERLLKHWPFGRPFHRSAQRH